MTESCAPGGILYQTALSSTKEDAANLFSLFPNRPTYTPISVSAHTISRKRNTLFWVTKHSGGTLNKTSDYLAVVAVDKNVQP